MADLSKMRALANKWLNGTITGEEKQEFDNWYNEQPGDTPEWKGDASEEELKQRLWKAMMEKIDAEDTPVATIPSQKRTILRRIAAAASVLLILSAGSYFILNNKTEKPIAKSGTQQRFKNDIAPGGNKAILTLANGKKIILDSAANGTISQQGNIKVIKLDSGQLAYSAAGSPLGAGGEVGLNTISTPRGGQYQITLADGSKVWLNAASSLRYPVSFNKDRNVELTGEGYFEVVHNAAKPFNVKVNGALVEDLGTHFNINAYTDEVIIKTTLLEGSVKVSKGIASQILKPGQQARINAENIKVANVDVEEVVAWKNGLFSFNKANIQTVMRQLARWYDVDVVFEGKVPDQLFGGEIQRNIQLSKVLESLEKNGVHFRIEDKKIVVLK